MPLPPASVDLGPQQVPGTDRERRDRVVTPSSLLPCHYGVGVSVSYRPQAFSKLLFQSPSHPPWPSPWVLHIPYFGSLPTFYRGPVIKYALVCCLHLALSVGTSALQDTDVTQPLELLQSLHRYFGFLPCPLLTAAASAGPFLPAWDWHFPLIPINKCWFASLKVLP